MLRNTAGKVMWVGRATVFLVGLAVILALVVGAASTALGADGKPFLLGKKNVATAVSKLVKKGAGPALSLQVGSGPPLAVNSSKKVAGLNVDQLDGQDSAQFFQGAGQTVDGRATMSSDSTAPVTNVPGFGSISVVRQIATSGNDCRAVFRNESGGELFRLGIRDNSGTVSSGVGDVDPTFGNGGEIELAGADLRPRSGFGTWQIVTPDTGKVLTLTVSAHFGVPRSENADCKVAVQGVYREH